MSSFTNVIVTVEDYNDCTPMFTENQYEVILMEDHSFGNEYTASVHLCY